MAVAEKLMGPPAHAGEGDALNVEKVGVGDTVRLEVAVAEQPPSSRIVTVKGIVPATVPLKVAGLAVVLVKKLALGDALQIAELNPVPALLLPLARVIVAVRLVELPWQIGLVLILMLALLLPATRIDTVAVLVRPVQGSLNKVAVTE